MAQRFVVPSVAELKAAKLGNTKIQVMQSDEVPSASASDTTPTTSDRKRISEHTAEPEDRKRQNIEQDITETNVQTEIDLIAANESSPQQMASEEPTPPTPASLTSPTPTQTSTPFASPNEIDQHLQSDRVIISFRQQKNPILEHIRHVALQYANIVPDFILGQGVCALYLTVRYHTLYPKYLHTRIAELGKQFRVRVLLVLVDTEDCGQALVDIAQIAIAKEMSMLLSWSRKEAARYIETFKVYEKKPADIIKPQAASDAKGRAADCLLVIAGINKTDVNTLLSNFGTFQAIANASIEQLLLCPGLGAKKVKRIYSAFHDPFRANAANLSTLRSPANIATPASPSTPHNQTSAAPTPPPVLKQTIIID